MYRPRHLTSGRTSRRLLGTGAVALATAVATVTLAGAAAASSAAPAATRPATPAAGYTPTLTVSPTSGGPGSYVRLKGTGWKPADAIYFYAGSTYFCSATPSASGVLPTTACALPSVPHGAITLSGQQDSNTIAASTSFTVTSRVTYLSQAAVSPGAVVTVSAGGLAGSSALSARVDTTTATTNPPAISSDASGSVSSLQVTIPTGTTAGTHTLAIRDSAGNQATKTITVYTPTFAVTPANASPGTPVSVSGGGWKPGGTVYVYADTTYFCAVSTSSTGAISGSCTEPSVPAGTHVLSGQQASTGIIATQNGSVSPGFTYLNADSATRGTTLTVNAAGFAASSALTATISGYSGALTTNPSAVSSDGNGTANGLFVTLPTSTSLAVGTHTLTLTDGASHSANTTVTVYAPTLTVSPTSGSPGHPVSVSGAKWRPGDPVYLYLGTSYFGSATPDSTGAFAGSYTLPGAPAGSTVVTGDQESGNAITVAKAFTVKPGLTYQSTQYVSPGATVSLNAGGLDPSVGYSVLVGKATATSTGPATTDTYGTANGIVVTIPAGTKAGQTTITVKDKASKAMSAAGPLQVLTPTLTVSPTGVTPQSPLRIGGTGWRPDDTAYVYLTAGTVSVVPCGVRADANGVLNGSCSTPSIPAGSYASSAVQDGTVTGLGPSVSVTPAVTYLSSVSATAGGSIQLYAAGLTASSPVTVAANGTAVTLTAGTPTTDTSGNVGYLTVTLPSTLAAGSRTLTVTDGAGKVASATLTVLSPTVTLSDTSVAAGSTFTVNGSGFDGGTTALLYLDATNVCNIGVDASGDFTGSCTVPTGTAAGSHQLSVQQDSGAVVVKQSLTTT